MSRKVTLTVSRTIWTFALVVVGVGAGVVAIGAEGYRLHARMSEAKARLDAARLDLGQTRDQVTVTEREMVNLMQALEAKNSRGGWQKFIASGYAKGCNCDRRIRTSSGVKCIHYKTARPTSIGEWPEANWTVAASAEDFALGQEIEVSYRGKPVARRVEDRGSAVTKGRLDIFFDSCAKADEWEEREVWARVRPGWNQ